MKITFEVNHTKHGCTVWMKMSNGNCRKARFRNGICAALTSAENWVWEQRQIFKEEASIRGIVIDVEVPPQLDRMNDKKYITQPVDWWVAFEEAAKAEGVSLSVWLGKAAKAKLSSKAQ